jgi:N-acetylneuraminic acid mutarotase
VAPTTSAWREFSSASARQEVAAAVVGGKIYVVGGLVADGGATDMAEYYDPADQTWNLLPVLPIKVHHAMAAELDGKLMVLGGFVSGGAATDRTFILEGNTWQEGPRMRHARGAGAAVTVTEGDARVIVVGGVSGQTHVGPVEIYDGTGWRDGAPIPSMRDHIGAATDGRFVYVAGGRRSGGHFGTFEAYDPETDRWEKLADMPTARSGLGAAVIGRAFLAVGGEGPRIFPEVEAYNVDTGKWSRLPDLAIPVHGVGVAAVGTNLYAVAGGFRVGLAPSRAAQVLKIG